jgi:hypothetical protein
MGYSALSFNEVDICFVGLMMKAVRTTETSVYFNEITWPYIPEGEPG